MQYLIGAITSQLKEQQYSYQQPLNNNRTPDLMQSKQRNLNYVRKIKMQQF